MLLCNICLWILLPTVGQALVLQFCAPDACPLHWEPPFDGIGFVQALDLVCDPVPQVRVHVDHWLHNVQPP